MATQLNLLPYATCCALEHRRQRTRWLIAWMLSLTAMCGMHLLLCRTKDQLVIKLAVAQSAVEPLRDMEAHIQGLASQTQQHKHEVATYEVLEQADVPLGLLIVVSDAIAEMGDSVQLQSVRLDEYSNFKASESEWSAPLKQIQLSGIARGNAAVSDLAKRLRGSHLFQHVDIDHSQVPSREGETERTFQIRCQQ